VDCTSRQRQSQRDYQLLENLFTMHILQRFLDRIEQEVVSDWRAIKIKNIEHAKELYVLQATTDAEYEEITL